jgi:hypothetical protein
MAVVTLFDKDWTDLLLEKLDFRCFDLSRLRRLVGLHVERSKRHHNANRQRRYGWLRARAGRAKLLLSRLYAAMAQERLGGSLALPDDEAAYRTVGRQAKHALLDGGGC